MKLIPIGRVVNGIHETPDDWDEVKSKILVDGRFVKGLYKLGHFKHVWIVFGFHKQKQTVMRVHPMHDPRKPLVGVFASRSPTRPNKIGITLVDLMSVRENLVTVKGLDAFDGSPVYDIKPYEDEIDY